jgi:hypothetical protein
MLLPSIRRLALADVTDEVLRELVNHGESLLVERKREPPKPPRFGAGVAAFANTLGGFVLLGVADDKTIAGWAPPEGSDVQSHLADLLRQQVDPLPPFVAEARELDEKVLTVIRVFESADAPHIVRGTGAVYLRSSKGKEPVSVDDQRTLLELARRGRDAEQRARNRLVSQPLVEQAMYPPFSTRVTHVRDPHHVRVIVRAAPVTVTPQFEDWPISSAGAERVWQTAASLYGSGEQPLAEPHARGVVARRYALKPGPGDADWGAVVAADSAGVVAATLTQGANSPLALRVLRAQMIRPVLNAVCGLLEAGEAYGRATLDAWVCLPGDLAIQESDLPLSQPEDVRESHVAGELTIPASDEELAALGRRWERELGRGFRIRLWEDGD